MSVACTLVLCESLPVVRALFLNNETIAIHACLSWDTYPAFRLNTHVIIIFIIIIIICVQYRSSTTYAQAYSLATPHIHHLCIQLPLLTPAAKQFSGLAHMDLFKFKSSKKGSSGDRASGQSSSPDSSRRGLRDRLGLGPRSRSQSRPPSPAVENTPDGSTTPQSQTKSASIHAQPDGSYPETPSSPCYLQR